MNSIPVYKMYCLQVMEQYWPNTFLYWIQDLLWNTSIGRVWFRYQLDSDPGCKPIMDRYLSNTVGWICRYRSCIVHSGKLVLGRYKYDTAMFAGMVVGSRVLHPLPFCSINVVLKILLIVRWLLSTTALPWG